MASHCSWLEGDSTHKTAKPRSEVLEARVETTLGSQLNSGLEALT